MSNDPSPLKYMGTQSQETVNMAAALARATEQAAGQTADGRAGKVDKASSSVADAGSRISAAANWAVDKAKEDPVIFEHLGDVYFQLQEHAKAKSAWQTAERAALKATPPDKRLPEIRKKLDSLGKLGQVPKNSTVDRP